METASKLIVVNNPVVAIIGISDYESEHVHDLPDSTKDVHKLCHLWKDVYGYDVYTSISNDDDKKAWTEEDIREFLYNLKRKVAMKKDDEKKQNVATWDGIIVIVLSHGDTGKVITSDGKFVAVKSIVGCFEEFSNLPKLFIFDGAGPGGSAKTMNMIQTNAKANNYLTLFASAPGQIVMNGNHFCDALVKTFQNVDSEDYPFYEICQKISDKLYENTSGLQTIWKEGPTSLDSMRLIKKKLSISTAKISVLALVCPGSGKTVSAKQRQVSIKLNGKDIEGMKDDIKSKDNDDEITIKHSIQLGGTIEDLNKLNKWLNAFDNVDYLSSGKHEMKIKPYLSNKSALGSLLTAKEAINKITKWIKEESDCMEYVLYFSGHGAKKGIGFGDYLVSYKNILNLIIPQIALNRRVNIIIDACHSGGIVEALKDIRKKNKYGIRIKNVCCFYASQTNEVSADLGLKGGAFSKQIFDPQKYDLWKDWFSGSVNYELFNLILQKWNWTYKDGTKSTQTPGIFWYK
eukprot:534494_1